MSHIIGNAQVAGMSSFESSAEAPGTIGSKVQDSQGRTLRLVKAGGTAVTRGKLQLAPAPKTNHHEMATNTAAAGDEEVTVTLGATAAVANEYAGGFLVVNDDTGEGMAYEVQSHPAADSAASLVVTLRDPIKVAFGAGTTATLVHNHFNGVVEGTSQTQKPVGVAVNNIAADEYGWVVSRGVAPTLADATIAVGADIVTGSSTAGAVEAASDTAATNVDTIKIGNAIVAGVDGEYRPVEIEID